MAREEFPKKSIRSERNEQNATRAELQSWLVAIVESSDDAIIGQTLDGNITSWNSGAERIFGYKAEEVMGCPVSMLAWPGHEEDMPYTLSRIRRGERIDHYETQRRRKDGQQITVSLTVSPIRDSSGTIVGASKVARDISAQRQAEHALRTAEKLAVAGRLAASIAHEINNPLEAVTNLLYLIEQEELPDRAREYLNTAQQELARVGHITVKTLGFYRASAKDTPVDVTEIIEEALSLHRGRFVHHGVELRRRYTAIPRIEGNAGELRQVFANLVGNAVDAMPQGGALTLRIRRATRFSDNEPGIRITVADTGRGMSAETQRRLFEPFYTTKGATGTGLGLWVSAEIIARHGGRLSLWSSEEPGRHGSVFALFLPARGVPVG